MYVRRPAFDLTAGQSFKLFGQRCTIISAVPNDYNQMVITFVQSKNPDTVDKLIVGHNTTIPSK